MPNIDPVQDFKCLFCGAGSASIMVNTETREVKCFSCGNTMPEVEGSSDDKWEHIGP